MRLEKKYLLQTVDHQELIQLIKLSRGGFKEIFHERKINNIYFENAMNTSLIDNVDGNSIRYKYRVRWYGDTYGKINKPILEVKAKEGDAGSKTSFPLPHFYLPQNEEQSRLDFMFNLRNANMAAKNYLSNKTPALINSYTRRYFQNDEKTVRLTIDYNILYHQNWLLGKHIACQHKSDYPTVLELKYDVNHNPNIDDITSKFQFRMSKSSKYVMGRLLTDF